MPLRARFRPHRRGFGFATPVGSDGLTAVEAKAPDEQGVERSVDSVFVPPALARGLVADDLVEVDTELDAKGASATAISLVDRPRRMLVGRVQQGPARLVLELDGQLGTGWAELDASVAQRLVTSVGRQIVVLAAADEDGTPIGRALVAGPHVVGSPAAVRAAATVITLGAVAPSLVPGGPQAAGLEISEALTTHTRVVGLLAGGSRGGAAGLDLQGPIPGSGLAPVDSREEPCITIDSATTRDIDDAIAATWDGSETEPVRVAVHIADVAAYVGVDSPADRYARTVASTAYLAVGDNAPMLDPALAEEALSLLPGHERWVITVRFEVTGGGAIEGIDLDTEVIRSDARLSYGALEPWLAGDRAALRTEAGEAADPAEGVLSAALEASRRLGAERADRSTLETLFTSNEVEPAVVDGKLVVVDAEPHADAYRLIERLMVAANEAVARWLVEREVPALYRTHVGLSADGADRLRAAARLADAAIPAVGLDDDEPDPDAVLTQLLAEVERLGAEGRDADRDLLATAATSSVARATYDPDPSHHRGLDAAAYTHFTSPIRRYADLVVHRQIRAALAGEAPPHELDALPPLARWLDARAGALAHLASRERNDLWAILLDRGYVEGAEPAIVTGLTPNGMRVRLPRLGLGGFVTAERALGLPARERGRLEIDEHGLTTTSGPWRLGSRVQVRVTGLDDSGRPNLRLASTPAG